MIISNKNDKFINYKRNIRPMTLIIGMKFKDGVLLVSDRKVVEIPSMSVSYENKLAIPDPNKALVIGCAGLSNLFNQFNRKIPLIVGQKLREMDLKNRKSLFDLGINVLPTYKEIIPEKIKKTSVTTNPKPIEEKETILLPYIYSNEDFIDDSKKLIRELCTNNDGSIENNLDALLILEVDGKPRLHHINCDANEEEVDCSSIGSGSIFVDFILKQFWKKDNSIEYNLKLAYFCIYFVQYLKLDNYVGVEENKLPDNLIILNDGRLVTYTFDKEIDVIKEIISKVNIFKNSLDSLSF